MEGLALRDPEVYPDEKVLKKLLGKNFTSYSKMMTLIREPDFSFDHEWRFYNDGKAWLCKVTHKKKTIFWLSFWEEGFFKAVFYFTDKHSQALSALDVDKKVIEEFNAAKGFGKLKPLIFIITTGENLSDLMTVSTFKKKLK